MSDQRPLGERVAAIEATLEALTTQIEDMHRDIKRLLAFRAWVMGLAAIMGGIGSILLKPIAAWIATR